MTARGRRRARRPRLPRRRLRGRARPPHRRARRAGGRARRRRGRVRRLRRRRGRLPAGAEPGRAAAPLARIASGGELSRVALAIKQVLAEADETPDARVRRGRHGHRRAERRPGRVGASGRSRAATRSCASRTCRRSRPMPTPSSGSSKRERDGRTVTEVERLDREGRIVELAQMLGATASGTPAGGEPGRAPASSSTVPRPGAARSRRPADARPMTAGTMAASRPSTPPSTTTSPTSRSSAGSPPATIRAYRGDLDRLRGQSRYDRRLGALAGRRGRVPGCTDAARAPAATRGSRRPASAAARRRSRASIGSRTARG